MDPFQQKILRYSIIIWISVLAVLTVYYLAIRRPEFALFASIIATGALISAWLNYYQKYEAAFYTLLSIILITMFAIYPLFRHFVLEDEIAMLGSRAFIAVAIMTLIYCGMLANRATIILTAVFLVVSCWLSIAWARPDDPLRYAGIPIMLVSIGLSTAMILVVQTVSQRNLHQLKRQIVVSRAANRTKSEFLRNMSHEFRTPMNIILGSAYLLQKQSEDPEVNKHASTIKSSAMELLNILNSILALDQIETGKMESQRETFNPEELLQTICEKHANKIQHRGIAFEYPNNTDAEADYHGSPKIIQKILTQLLSNAEKFTTSGVIKVESMIENDSSPVRWKVCVSDTGVGIPKSQQRRIFERFTQADGSPTRQFGGTGVGLALARELCETIDAEVSLVSSSEKGSMFCLTVPLEKV